MNSLSRHPRLSGVRDSDRYDAERAIVRDGAKNSITLCFQETLPSVPLRRLHDECGAWSRIEQNVRTYG